MLKQLKKRYKPKVETLNTISVNKTAILNNIAIIRALQPNNAVFPVLKSNAYGHGIQQILEIIKGQDFPYLIVDSFPEYQIIHNNSKFNILIMGETLKENYRYFDYKRTTVAVYNIQTLHYLISLKKKIKIHLFLNTGMNREGIQKQNLQTFLDLLKSTPQITLEGVMSHLYDADQNEKNHINEQIATFKSMTEIIESAGFHPIRKHIGASAGMTNINDNYFTARRPGLIFYGYSPFSDTVEKLKNLTPALKLNSTIISLQEIQANEGVSYNHKRMSKTPCTTATVPFGYYEGRLRTLSGKLTYYYHNQPTQQLGTICMNLSSILALPGMQVGDKIELICDDNKKENSICSIAEKANTIPYEILIRLDKGIRRIIN